MHSRVLLLLILAGCASPDSALVAIAQQSGVAPPPTVESTRPSPGFGGSGDSTFDAWRQDFVQRQRAAGWSEAFLRQHLGALTPDPRVVALDSRQPEFSKPVGDYLRGSVSEDRVSIGRSKRAAAAWLPGVEARYGVPAEILVAIWGMESAFGASQGGMDVVRSLATLAAEGRRRGWAEGQLLAALRMLRDGDAAPGTLKGSWAGAMGQTQFMPDTFLSTAVDGDGDGRRDIWSSSPDALASAANLLARAGWRSGESWAVEVTLPAGFDYSLSEGPRQRPADWQALGARRADARGFSQADAGSEAQLIVPAGHRGPAFLVFPNHFVIRKYNNSTSYALGVGMLADRIAGRGGVIAAWPAEQPLSSVQRTAAQHALNRLGFAAGEPDGVVGINTRAAVRAYQRSRGLVADGYLDPDLVRRLTADQAAPPTTGH